MGGRAAPFGIDEEDLACVVEQAVADPAIELMGLHLFLGTQILQHETLLRQYRHAIDIAKRVATRLEKPLQTLDFGGGLGVPYFPHERELDLRGLSAGLAGLMDELRGDPAFAGTRFVVEPGRFLVAEAGIYVSRVNDIKVSRGKKFLILDGGMHHHLAASGNLGQTIKRNYPVVLLNRLDDARREVVDVVGPLCTPLDVLARGVSLPVAEVGDLVGVFQSGAYARTASPLGFLSHPTPPEVWVDGGLDHLIRRRGRYEDHLRDQCEVDVGRR
jgi:diaminopimelate decarboxylase